MKLKEKLHIRKIIYKGKSVNFSADIIKLPDGKKAIREYLEHPGAVAVLPILSDGRIVLVKQYRYPIKKITYEIPAGKLDNGGENLISCVRRELQEETGFCAEKIKKIFSYYPTPAFGTEIIHIFVAENLTKTTASPDQDEFIETKIVPFKTAVRWVLSGKIKDSKTIIAILLFNYFAREKKP